jgi:2-hydroxy-3-keto-5-methylthiopentenyl-1-phosphate phosphatase
MKFLIITLFIIFSLLNCANIVVEPISINETPKIKEYYEKITSTDINGIYFNSGINDIMYHAWTLFSGKMYGLITENQISNFCTILKSLEKEYYYISHK